MRIHFFTAPFSCFTHRLCYNTEYRKVSGGTVNSDLNATFGHRRLQKSTRSVAPPKPSLHVEG